ncbi:MAG: hypothetical protein KAJ63_03485 [Methyloprofundus sp.]|nr:hypothetical protein [Methyloprofundus sp.]
MIKAILMASIASLFLVACDDQQKKSPAIKVPVQKYKQLKVLKGSVLDEKGSVLKGTLKVTDSTGREVASTHLENSKHYSVEIPAGTTLPIVLTVKPKGSSETLRAVVISAAVSSYDISPLTTKIAKRAKELGGYTYSNMVMAAESTVGVPDANKTSTGFRGDPTKQYGGWH